MKLIGLCGKIGSGKDTFADYLVKKHGFVKLTMSDIIVKEMEAQGIKDIDRHKMQEFSDENKKKYGKDIWARACIAYAQKQKYRRVVISGMRDSKELAAFRILGKDFIFVCIKANQEVRFKRTKSRKSIKDVGTFADFIRQEVDEAKIFDIYEKGEEVADYVFDNSNTVIELYAFAEDLIKKLGWQ